MVITWIHTVRLWPPESAFKPGAISRQLPLLVEDRSSRRKHAFSFKKKKQNTGEVARFNAGDLTIKVARFSEKVAKMATLPETSPRRFPDFRRKQPTD